MDRFWNKQSELLKLLCVKMSINCKIPLDSTEQNSLKVLAFNFPFLGPSKSPEDNRTHWSLPVILITLDLA